MPEIPEVEALAAALLQRAGGTLISRIDLAAISALKTFDPPVTAVEGCLLTEVTRHGKYLDLALVNDDGEPIHLLIHLSRAGWVTWREEVPAAPPRPGKGPLAARIGFVTTDGEPAGGIDITEAGTQKRLTLHVVRDPMDVERVATLGPDPLAPGFTADTLRAILESAGRSQIKGVLKDQRIIAGIGNAYSDEILHVARVSPFAPASSVNADELLAAIRGTLTEAIAAAQATDPTRLKAEKKRNMRVHGRTGQPCPVCQDTVREVSFADSSLQYCPTCQTGGKPLADRRMSRLLK